MATTIGIKASQATQPRLFAFVFFLAPLVTLTVPRLTAGLLPVAVVALLVAGYRQGLGWRQLWAPSAALTACVVFALYVLINATWAWSPSAGLLKGSLALGAVLCVYAATVAASSLDDEQSRGAAIAFVAGALLGAIYLLVELLTAGGISRFLLNTFPMLRPNGTKHFVMEAGEIARLHMSKLFNRNATIAMLALWPGMLMLGALAKPKQRALALVVFFAVFAAAIVISDHDSSQVALVGSALVFLVAWKWRRFAIRGLAALWCLAFALVMPINFLAYDANLHLAKELPLSYRARIILWEYTSEQTLLHPWLGVGANSTREKDSAGVDDADSGDRPEGFVFDRTTGHHAHSVFLQTWYELGALGALLLAVAGGIVALRMERLPRAAQPFAAATFAAFALIAAFAWGMWQTWWICAAALTVIYLCLAARQAETHDEAWRGDGTSP